MNGRPACAGHPTLPAYAWDTERLVHLGETAEEQARRHEAAAAVCLECPIADACRAVGMAGRAGGIRDGHPFPDRVAGYRSDDRAAVYGAGKRGRPPCGTPGGAKAHRDRGEPVDDDCAEAYREANRERMAATREAAREAGAA